MVHPLFLIGAAVAAAWVLLEDNSDDEVRKDVRNRSSDNRGGKPRAGTSKSPGRSGSVKKKKKKTTRKKETTNELHSDRPRVPELRSGGPGDDLSGESVSDDPIGDPPKLVEGDDVNGSQETPQEVEAQEAEAIPPG